MLSSTGWTRIPVRRSWSSSDSRSLVRIPDAAEDVNTCLASSCSTSDVVFFLLRNRRFSSLSRASFSARSWASLAFHAFFSRSTRSSFSRCESVFPSRSSPNPSSPDSSDISITSEESYESSSSSNEYSPLSPLSSPLPLSSSSSSFPFPPASSSPLSLPLPADLRFFFRTECRAWNDRSASHNTSSTPTFSPDNAYAFRSDAHASAPSTPLALANSTPPPPPFPGTLKLSSRPS